MIYKTDWSTREIEFQITEMNGVAALCLENESPHHARRHEQLFLALSQSYLLMKVTTQLYYTVAFS